jgi:hypothetical protein
MDPLAMPDHHHLRAAEGWLELGNPAEGEAELDRISQENQRHPEVLHIRWQLGRSTKSWDRCFEIAHALTDGVPKDPRAWTALAQTLYFTNRIEEAYTLAVSKITTFPKHWPLYYDAACYACLTGRLEQAKQFLQVAAALGEADQIQRLAANDPDLKDLWKKEN